MKKNWNQKERDEIWTNYLHKKMLVLFPINLTNRDPFALHYEGINLKGKQVEIKIPLFALEAICPQCGQLMHHDFYEENNFENASWSIDFIDNNQENQQLENLWPMHQTCLVEKQQSWLNNLQEQKGEQEIQN